MPAWPKRRVRILRLEPETRQLTSTLTPFVDPSARPAQSKVQAQKASLKEWAAGIAAAAPPLNEDQFRQINVLLSGSAPRVAAMNNNGVLDLDIAA